MTLLCLILYHQICFYAILNIPLKSKNFHGLSLSSGCGVRLFVQLTQVVEKTQIHKAE